MYVWARIYSRATTAESGPISSCREQLKNCLYFYCWHGTSRHSRTSGSQTAHSCVNNDCSDRLGTVWDVPPTHPRCQYCLTSFFRDWVQKTTSLHSLHPSCYVGPQTLQGLSLSPFPHRVNGVASPLMGRGIRRVAQCTVWHTNEPKMTGARSAAKTH